MIVLICCHDIVRMVVDAATEEFAPGHIVSRDKADELFWFCDKIDSIMTEKVVFSYDFEVNPDDKSMLLTAECDKAFFSEHYKELCGIVDDVSAIGLSYEVGSDDIKLSFALNGIWEAANE